MENLEKDINRNLKLFPTTRYQGSKRRILSWLYQIFTNLKFESVLDGFGGTASVSYLLKLMGKRVTFNDILTSNYQSGIALIENDITKLEESDINFLLQENGYEYPSFIQNNFDDIYYYQNENEWLDRLTFNIKMLSERYKGIELKNKRALAYHALFQACLSKRPFNLFHRKNLYLRNASVHRSFGNKKTWEIEFPVLFKKFAEESSNKVFSNKKNNKAICGDILNLEKNNYDLIYLDPPYQRPKDSHPKDYYSLYHFLEGIVDYDNWLSRIDFSKKHRPLFEIQSDFKKKSLFDSIEIIVNKFSDSMIAISYGEPGIPNITEIQSILEKYKSRVIIYNTVYSYKLNKKNGNEMREVLLLGL
jgi:adenine-specific DNA methylase